MSKKGLSFDEKKVRLLAYMHEHKEVYTLPELEKGAAKAKGIVSQSVKEVLQHLISDGTVEQDKIGAGNFYWALPGKAKANAQSRVSKLKRDVEAAEALVAENEEKLQAAQAARPTSKTRAADLKTLAQLKSQEAELSAEVAKYADSDPDRLKLLERGTEISKAACSRWADNLQTLISAMREARPEISEEAIMDQHGIKPKDLEPM